MSIASGRCTKKPQTFLTAKASIQEADTVRLDNLTLFLV